MSDVQDRIRAVLGHLAERLIGMQCVWCTDGTRILDNAWRWGRYILFLGFSTPYLAGPMCSLNSLTSSFSLNGPARSQA